MRIIKYFLLIICLTIPVLFFWRLSKYPEHTKFDTLSDLKNYAAFYPEFVKSDNNDWIDPEYTSFYPKTLGHSFFKKIAINIGIKKDPVWNIYAFETLLKQVTEKRKKEKNSLEKTIEVKDGDSFIIFGDLHGAFHSMVRNLDELKKTGIINESLEIIKNNLSIIILGDAISRSPYSLELLHILLVLIHKNPGKIFYLQGNHETDGYWENFSMRRALKYISPVLGKNTLKHIPLEKEINKFFSTLPKTLIITHKKNNREKIFCSYSNICKKLLDDITVKLILLGEKRLDVIKEQLGLTFLGYQRTAARWSLISCPTEIYKNFFNFFHDAFVELSIGNSIATSILTLHNRNIKTGENYKQKHFNPTFGYEIKNKKEILDKKTIFNVGSTMSLTGITGPLGRETKLGLETAIYAFNRKKTDRLIKPVIFDDGYVPRIALSNIKTMLNQYNIESIIIPTGTPTLSLYWDMVKKGEIAVLFPYTGGSQFRKKEIKNIVHFRASYDNEVKSSIKHLVKEHGIRNFAFFYQKDSYGLPIAKAAHEELKKYGITKWLDLPHLKTQADFTYLVEQVKKEMPGAIGCFSSHFPTQEFISKLGAEFFLGRILFGVSFLYSEAFQRFLEHRGIDFILSSVVPDPITSTIQIAKEHKKNMLERGLKSSTNSLEAYISAELLANAIKNVSSPFTKEKIINYFENLNNYKFKGLTLTFNPETRDLSQPVWIRTIENKWLKYRAE